MFKSLGLPEILIILLIVLLVFGAGRLQEVGSGLGKAIRGFKDSVSGKDEEKPKAEVASAASGETKKSS